ncbi:MAG: alpha/beta fold hydrolase [Candidatus Omnitrophica bacterium]|nr:alpha/beta fold hydrolase [Candidatus Omnitrophota bacterium]
MPSIKTNHHINWNYETEGTGKDLLFIHGWGVDLRIWRQQLKYFSTHRRVISVDLPGHGSTDWQPDFTLAQIAEDVITILEAEEAQDVDVVGSSLGGLVALKSFEADPAMFGSLIFVGSMPRFSKTSEYPYGVDVQQMLKVSRQLQMKFPDVLKSFFRSTFTFEERQSRRFKWMERFRRDAEPPNLNAIKEYLEIIYDEDLRDVLMRVNIPVAFFYGEGDVICPLAAMEEMKKIVPAGTFQSFEKLGHFPFLTAPDQFNEVLDGFLKLRGNRQ